MKFLQRLDVKFSGKTTLHLILDNYGTHGHARVQRWLQRHPRFVLHFIPTSSSWLNLIERWFAELSQKAVRRGAFHSVRDLQRTITAFHQIEVTAQSADAVSGYMCDRECSICRDPDSGSFYRRKLDVESLEELRELRGNR